MDAPADSPSKQEVDAPPAYARHGRTVRRVAFAGAGVVAGLGYATAFGSIYAYFTAETPHCIFMPPPPEARASRAAP